MFNSDFWFLMFFRDNSVESENTSSCDDFVVSERKKRVGINQEILQSFNELKIDSESLKKGKKKILRCYLNSNFVCFYLFSHICFLILSKSFQLVFLLFSCFKTHWKMNLGFYSKASVFLLLMLSVFGLFHNNDGFCDIILHRVVNPEWRVERLISKMG